MGCPNEVMIGDDLVFSVCTHNVDTGVLTDADSVPTYRIYEDETATPILTGSMAKLDDANTTGFYSKLISCTTGNGFEAEKTYTIYIEGTVDSIQGAISYGFKAKTGFNISEIDGSAVAASNLSKSASVIVQGSAVAGTLSTTQMSTNLTEDTDDHYNGRIIIWTTGNLAKQATDITDYDGTSKTLTFTAVTEAPSIGNEFVIV